jgi:hypothetical protein
MQLVGIHGLKRSGKDTLGRLIQRKLKFSEVRRVAFADMLKRVTSELTGVPLVFFYSGEAKDKVIPGLGITPRRLLGNVSEALKGCFGDDLFTNHVRRLWEDRERLGFSTLIITDVRLESEAYWIRDAGGVVVHVTRTGWAGESDYDLYEAGIRFLPQDYRITNDGNLPELSSAVDEFLTWWVGPPE